jgi:hypothetical protein
MGQSRVPNLDVLCFKAIAENYELITDIKEIFLPNRYLLMLVEYITNDMVGFSLFVCELYYYYLYCIVICITFIICLYVRIICSYYMFVLYVRIVRLYCTFVLYICSVRLYCTFVLYYVFAIFRVLLTLLLEAKSA